MHELHLLCLCIGVMIGIIAIIGLTRQYGMFKSITLSVILFLLLLAASFFFTWYQNGFIFRNYNFTISFLFTPMFTWALCKVYNLPFLQIIDTIISPLCATLFFDRIGCFFSNEEYGIPFSWGLYNEEIGLRLFPLQPMEALLAFSLMVFSFIQIQEDKRVYHPGRNCSLTLIALGYLFFFLEFFSEDVTFVLRGNSAMLIWGLLIGTMGVLMTLFCSSFAHKK